MYTHHLPRGETQVQKVKEEAEEDPVADLAQLVAKANLPGIRALVPPFDPLICVYMYEFICIYIYMYMYAYTYIYVSIYI